MPIQELAPVTLSDVEHALAEFEGQYEITSADFLNISETSVPDDDAAEWNYLLKQKEALQAEARSAVLSSISAGATMPVYRFTRLAKRIGPALDDQYDCAA